WTLICVVKVMAWPLQQLSNTNKAAANGIYLFRKLLIRKN
ncbi:MAG: hypothetical protein ACI9ES_003354, partial [Oceanospirillaceae bacterium]